jgi:hypothetical protein
VSATTLFLAALRSNPILAEDWALPESALLDVFRAIEGDFLM